MPVFVDQTGRQLLLINFPSRIVSLVPSQTELLFDLGLETEVAGITKFCIHPREWAATKTKVGGTKTLHKETIHQLQPDIIFANKEENSREQIEELAAMYPVWVSDVNNLDNACEMILQIGLITGKKAGADKLVEEINDRFQSLRRPVKKTRACYLIWQKPFMTVGGDTFIHSMLEVAGLENVFKDSRRYPVVSIEDIRDRQPELLMLSSEPFPFKETHVDQLAAFFPGTKISLVDGEVFSWYGSRMLYAPGYFLNLQRNGVY